MNKTPLLIYTHSDCSFIWPALIDLVNKNVELEIHFAYDKTFKDLEKHNIPINWIKHVYDDSMIWTDRIATILNEIDDKYVLFIHEDWLPTNKVTNVVVNDMVMFMEKNEIDYLLSYSHISTTSIQEGIPTTYDDYFFYKEKNHIFQPAIWKTKTFKEFSNTLKKGKNQNEDEDCLNFMGSKKCFSVQNIKTVTSLRTTNSLFFPHMHALSQGLWNFTKYPQLKELLNSYDIDTDSRGIHSWWELDTQ